jgi:hypothetical protein
MASASPAVLPARPAPINDRQLDQLARIAHDAPQSLATEAECEWLIHMAGPLLEELRRWRVFGQRIDMPVASVNVIHLCPPR